MGIYREKVVPFFKQWDFAVSSYLFLKGFFNLARYGLFYPTGYIDIPEKKLAYISLPKAGSSSVKVSITNQSFKDDYSIHALLRDKYGKKNIDREYFTFTFVRNPFDRLVSCYESKYHHDALIAPEKSKYTAFNHYFLGILSKDKGFENFVIRICLLPKRFAEEHFRSQYLTLYRHSRCVADYIGKFENLEADYEPIRQKYDFSPLAHYNQSCKGDWRDYYTPQTAKMVYRKFKKDFETFGYECEYEKLLTYLSAKRRSAVISL